MKVSLVDVDSLIPNLALMKLSSYYKQQGIDVGFYNPLLDHPDRIHASKIFDFTPDFEYYPNDCEILKGGTGYDVTAKLPDGLDRIMPDYSLYNWKQYSIGRFTRGCPNNCPWCCVPKADGNEIRRVANLSDFLDPSHDTVRLLDDNILADCDVFAQSCEQIRKAGVKAIFDALDIRLVNDQAAKALKSIKGSNTIHFAWDGHHQDKYIEPGLSCLFRNGIKPYRLMFYVLIGYNTTPEYDLFRVRELWKHKVYSFAMPYDKNDRYQRDFARWCNNKAVFKSVRWEEYKCPTNKERS